MIPQRLHWLEFSLGCLIGAVLLSMFGADAWAAGLSAFALIVGNALGRWLP